jgi:methylmalonyl-CoA mutase
MSSGLADGFPPATLEQWRQAADPKGEGKPFASTLEDGIEVPWLYTSADSLAPDPGGLPGVAPFVRGTRVGQRWAIRQRTRVSGATSAELDRANRQILEDLEGGATEVLLSHGGQIATVDELDQILNGVLLDLAPVALDWEGATDAQQNAVAELLLELWRRREIAPQEVYGSLRIRSVGRIAGIRAEFPNVKVIGIDTSPSVDAGAGAVLELALALHEGTKLLREGEEAGLAPAEVAGALEFTLVADADQFLEIAKLRAFRRLWASVLEYSGVPAAQRNSAVYIQTSRRMLSPLDPSVNILRDTTATFAAAIGGADGVTVVPFDEPIGEPGALARRIARNTQIVLAEESSLYRVADPAGGSWYVESLTEQVAQAAWAQFQRLQAGEVDVEAEITAAREARQHEIATRRRSLTGVNQFPLLGDDGLERSPGEPSRPRQISRGARAGSPANTRDGVQFELLRARAASLGEPKILLACVGPLAAHVNAAQWAKNFFEAGGVTTVAQTELAPDGFRVAAVCTGKTGDPAPTVAALRDAGIEQIYAVGADAEGAERIKDGVDMVAVLSALLDRFEAAA